MTQSFRSASLLWCDPNHRPTWCFIHKYWVLGSIIIWFLSMAIQIANAPPKHKTCSQFTNLVSVHQTQDSTTNSSSLILALPLQMYGQNTSSLLSRMCLETGSGRVRSCSAQDQTSGLELCTGCGWKRRPMPGSLSASANQILAHFKTLWVAGIPSSRVYFSLLYNCGSQN